MEIKQKFNYKFPFAWDNYKSERRLIYKTLP